SSVGIAGVAGDNKLEQAGKDDPVSRICHRYEKFQSVKKASKDPSEPTITAAAAASSSSRTIHHIKYDVFLSFRGEDTQNNFTSHLYAALRGKQVHAFIDNDLKRGEEIPPSLLKAIEESKLSVIIFSPNYASSKWCLDELVKILECKNTNRQTVVPVFYCIDPSHVRHQTGSFRDAFARHEAKEQMVKVEMWRAALKEAANLSGWDSQVIRDEAELIGNIVEDVLKKLNRMYSSQSLRLVGIDSRAERIESLLCLESPEVRSLGIWGMGGIGKTTIAEVVFKRNHPQFQGFHFLANVREELKRHGVVAVWNRFLMEILDEKSLKMGSLRPSFVEERLRHMKLLVIFDDVDESMPIQFQELLARHHDLFGRGSKILITSRDRHVLKNLLVDEVYKVEELNFVEAFQVFSFSAFKKAYPSSHHINQSVKMVKHANGNPLALKILGSALFSRSEEDWNSVLNRLEKVSKPRIMDVLKGTEAIESMILDICNTREMHIETDAFASMGRLRFLKFWKSDYNAISSTNKVQLPCHGLQFLSSELRYLHWERFPSKSLPSNFSAENLVLLDLPNSKVQTLWTGLQQLVHLKRINLTGSKYLTEIPDLSKAQMIEEIILRGCKNLLSLPARIDSKYVRLLDLSFCTNVKQCPEISGNLEELYLGGTAIEQLPGSLHKLKFLRLLFTEGLNINKFPDIPESIKNLRLNGTAIEEVPSSIEFLTRLVELNLSDNEKLSSIPESIGKLKYLKSLSLSGCRNLKKLPNSIYKLKSLTSLSLDGTAIRELPSNFHRLGKVSDLDASEIKEINLLPLVGLRSLASLYLKGCYPLEICNALWSLSSITRLNLSDNSFRSLPADIKQLGQLRFLYLSNCRRICSIPELPQFLQILFANNCVSLQTISPIDSEFLCTLNLANCFRLDEEVCDKVLADAEARYQNGSVIKQQNLWQLYNCHQSCRHLPHLRCVCQAKAANGDVISDWECYPHDFPKSDHVLMWYTSSTSQEKECFSKYSEASFEFFLEWEDELGPQLVNNCQVKKSGVHLFFLDDQPRGILTVESDEDRHSIGDIYYYTGTGEDSCSNVDEDSDDDLHRVDSEENHSDVTTIA
ncbi:hypothetical protein Tsubulata_001333, partial [Turnera subulata]